MYFAIPADLRMKMKENETINKYLALSIELKKIVEYEDDGNANCSWWAWNAPSGIRKETGEIDNQN